MKKSGFAMLAVLGKPKGRNPNGVTSTSESSPDQSGDTMMGDDEQMEESQEDESDHDSPGDQMEEGEDLLDLPAGFKAPESSAGGGRFSTTISGCIVKTPDGPKMKVYMIGDMPLHGQDDEQKEEMDESEAPSDESPDQSYSPALNSERASRAKRMKDERAANQAFRS